MKILKQPHCQVFDTENPEKVDKNFSVKSNLLIPLHHSIVQMDWDFLKEKFGEKHIILEDFGNAYYYEILENGGNADDGFLNKEQAFKYVENFKKSWGSNLVGWVAQRENRFFPCFNVWD